MGLQEFSANLLLPFARTTLLLMLLAAGLWADRLGGRELWRVPAAALAGLAAGVLLGVFRLDLPYPAWGMAGAVVLLGCLVAAQVQLPAALALALVAVAAVYQGRGALAGVRPPLPGWLGIAAGALLALAAGTGLAVILGRSGQPRLVALAGAAIAVAGGLILFGVLR